VGQAEGPRVDQAAGAEVVQEEQPVLVRAAGERLDGGRLGESDDAEVAGVDAHDSARPFSDRALVVTEVRAVSRAHLDQARAGLAHDVWDSEAAADLDGLAAGDDDLAVPADR
jgi:hypothetical protein